MKSLFIKCGEGIVVGVISFWCNNVGVMLSNNLWVTVVGMFSF